jgi:hypothetical protein
MKNAKRYETAAIQLLGPVTENSDAGTLAITDAAAAVDDLIFTIAEDSRRLARNLSTHADQVEVVNYDVTAPTVSSLIGDITENSGRLREKRSALFTLIGALLGRDAMKSFSCSLG